MAQGPARPVRVQLLKEEPVIMALIVRLTTTEITSPKCRPRGSVDRAGLQSRPRGSSRVRLNGFGVGEFAPVDDVGQPAFQCSHRFHRGLAVGEFAPVVTTPFGVAVELDDGHDVQDATDAPVSSPRRRCRF